MVPSGATVASLWISELLLKIGSLGGDSWNVRSSLSCRGPAYGLRPVCCASSCSCGLPWTGTGVAPGLPVGSGTLDDNGLAGAEAEALAAGLVDAAALAAGLAGAAPLAAALGFALAAALATVEALAGAVVTGEVDGVAGAAAPPQAERMPAMANAGARFRRLRGIT